MKHFLWLLFLPLIIASTTSAQPTRDPNGYTLFTLQDTEEVYLIDTEGNIVHQWDVGELGRDAVLLENGNLIVTAPHTDFDAEFVGLPFSSIDGRFREFTWDGELVWEYEVDGERVRAHHGLEVLPNGNIMFLVWTYVSPQKAILNGRDPDFIDYELGLWPDSILEVDRTTNEIVWEWHMMEHLVQDLDATKLNFGNVAESPHLIDINFQEASNNIADWTHANNIDYNAELDQVMISVREFHEIWIIDHNTTIQEAAGPAGDLLYRWGNPRAYRQGGREHTELFFQHDAQWIPDGHPGAGNIIAFSNRHPIGADGGFYSTIVEFTPPLLNDGTYAWFGNAYPPENPVWTYGHAPSDRFASQLLSGVQRLPNGNTLVIEGQSNHIFEVTQNNARAWVYRTSPSAPLNIFRARRYQPDFPAFEGRDLSPKGRL